MRLNPNAAMAARTAMRFFSGMCLLHAPIKILKSFLDPNFYADSVRKIREKHCARLFFLICAGGFFLIWCKPHTKTAMITWDFFLPSLLRSVGETIFV